MIDEKYFLKHEHYILEEFEFKNGAVLKDVDVDYGVVGTPKYDEECNITNAVHGGAIKLRVYYNDIIEYPNLVEDTEQNIGIYKHFLRK